MPYKDKQKQKEYLRSHYAKHKEYYDSRQKKRRIAWNKWLDEQKLRLGPCKKCGEVDIRVLQFHHRNPKEKLFGISTSGKSGGCSKERVLKEIAKCDLLCANCHIIEHYDNRGL